MYKPYANVLKMCPLFAGLEEHDILSLLSCLRPVMRDFQKGDLLCQAGGPQETFGIVLSGEVQVQKYDFAGNRLIIGSFGPGELFGEVSAYAGLGLWPNTVAASAAGKVIFIPFALLSQTCCRACDFHQTMIRNMLGIVAHKAMIINNRLNFIKLRSMREKLAAFLYEQFKQSGTKTFLVAMNREELADYLNVSRPSMSRELGRMKDEGLIDFYRSSFTIKDIEALKLARV
ncbi:MAG TPA: transcriptional regulator [Clostridiales bacterium]|nr:transcriptional regulator [Clostridiales bacterium]